MSHDRAIYSVINITKLKKKKTDKPHYTKNRFTRQNTGLHVFDIVMSQ